jgi:hypothetical protein
LITEYSSAGAVATSAASLADESDFAVTVVDGVISGFGTHRHLLVSGAGPLVGVDATGLTACTLVLTFSEACVVTAMGTPASGSPIKTPRMGDANPQDIHVQADDVVELRLRPDAGTPFWKVTGGSFT